MTSIVIQSANIAFLPVDFHFQYLLQTLNKPSENKYRLMIGKDERSVIRIDG
jgi:hypothetical protein